MSFHVHLIGSRREEMKQAVRDRLRAVASHNPTHEQVSASVSSLIDAVPDVPRCLIEIDARGHFDHNLGGETRITIKTHQIEDFLT